LARTAEVHSWRVLVKGFPTLDRIRSTDCIKIRSQRSQTALMALEMEQEKVILWNDTSECIHLWALHKHTCHYQSRAYWPYLWRYKGWATWATEDTQGCSTRTSSCLPHSSACTMGRNLRIILKFFLFPSLSRMGSSMSCLESSLEVLLKMTPRLLRLTFKHSLTGYEENEDLRGKRRTYKLQINVANELMSSKQNWVWMIRVKENIGQSGGLLEKTFGKRIRIFYWPITESFAQDIVKKELIIDTSDSKEQLAGMEFHASDWLEKWRQSSKSLARD
jgi:hypothetical protein